MDKVTEAGLVAMLQRDHARMRRAGTALAEAALRVVRESDGLHRLSLAVVDWATAVADEGDRTLALRSTEPLTDKTELPDVVEAAIAIVTARFPDWQGPKSVMGFARAVGKEVRAALASQPKPSIPSGVVEKPITCAVDWSIGGEPAVDVIARAICGYDLDRTDSCALKCIAAGKCLGEPSDDMRQQAKAVLAALQSTAPARMGEAQKIDMAPKGDDPEEFPDTQQLRTLANGGQRSCLGKTPMVPVHIDTLRKTEAFLSWVEREWQSYMSHEDFRVEVAIRARAIEQEDTGASEFEALRKSRDSWRALELTHHATISALENLLERALCLMAEAQSCLDPDKDYGDKIAADLGSFQKEIADALTSTGTPGDA